MNEQINVTVDGKKIFAVADKTLSEIIKNEKPCGGHGRCGKCKVIAVGELSELSEAEKKLLSDDEIAHGVRLSCLTRALGDCEIKTFSNTENSQIVTDGELPVFLPDPIFTRYGVAIDVGTTTLASRLYSQNGKLLAEVSRINPQKKWGADVISRIEAALDGKTEALSGAIREALDGMITDLADIAGVRTEEIDGAVITGNTVMLSLLTNESVEPFSHAPFEAKRLFSESLSASVLGLSCLKNDTIVYLPPCISAFVGADTVCALLATELCNGESTKMLADIGTNGEMALWHNGSLFVCSTAAGPAFEGVGISMGMRGASGAIDKVFVEDGQIKAHIIGDTEPIGICGSGLVDAVACMLELETIDESGYLEQDEVVVSAPVSLIPKDIRALQLAKSAICAGLLTLLDKSALEASKVSSLYIAGGFGSYLNKESAARIGLLPRALAESSSAVGNAALTGASMILLGAKNKEKAVTVARDAKVVDLSADPVFSEAYMSGMMLEEI